MRLGYLFLLGCFGLASARAANEILERTITLQAKHFKAATLLEQVAVASGIHLVLPQSFPRSQEIPSLDARDSTLAQVFDSIARSTKSRWTAVENGSELTVTFATN
jgi:hypothetical protein